MAAWVSARAEWGFDYRERRRGQRGRDAERSGGVHAGGKFVGQFQVDSGAGGGAFGLAFQAQATFASPRWTTIRTRWISGTCNDITNL